MFIWKMKKLEREINNQERNLEVRMNIGNKEEDIKKVNFEVVKTVLYTDTLEEIY